jgi:hypothetical protein
LFQPVLREPLLFGAPPDREALLGTPQPLTRFLEVPVALIFFPDLCRDASAVFCMRFILAGAGRPADGQNMKTRVRVSVARMMCIFFRLLGDTAFGCRSKERRISRVTSEFVSPLKNFVRISKFNLANMIPAIQPRTGTRLS